MPDLLTKPQESWAIYPHSVMDQKMGLPALIQRSTPTFIHIQSEACAKGVGALCNNLTRDLILKKRSGFKRNMFPMIRESMSDTWFLIEDNHLVDIGFHSFFRPTSCPSWIVFSKGKEVGRCHSIYSDHTMGLTKKRLKKLLLLAKAY